MPRRSVKAAPNWFGALMRFVLMAIFPVVLICGRELPRSFVGLPTVVLGVVCLKDTTTPIEGARVWVPEEPVRFETRTDARGMFRLSVPSLGSGEEPISAWFDGYRIAASAEGMVPNGRAFHLSCPMPDPIPVQPYMIHLTPAVAAISGVARGPDGSPVPGTRIEIAGQPEVVADADGRFGPLPVAPGYARFTARAPGLAGTLTVFVFPGKDGVYDVELPMVAKELAPKAIGPVLRTRLLEADGSPAAGIRVECARNVTHTDEDGAFELPMRQLTLALLTCHEGRAFRGYVTASLESPERIDRLPRRSWVRGRVVDSRTGDSLPGAILRPLNVVTDEQGRFEAFASNPIERGHWLTVSRAGYEMMTPGAIAGDGSTIVEVRAMATVRLKVTDPNDAPLPTAWVMFRRAHAAGWSDEDGRVVTRVREMPSLNGYIQHATGSVQIVPGDRGIGMLFRGVLEAVGILDSASAEDFPVKPGDDLDLGTWAIPAPRGLPVGAVTPVRTVKVIDPDGKPVPWPFTINGEKIGMIGDENGVVIPTGRLILAEGFECLPLDLDLVKSGTVCLDRSVPVRGRLRSEGTKPMPAFEVGAVKLIRKDGRIPGGPLGFPPTFTDSQGRFVLHGIPRGGGAQLLGRYPRGSWMVLGQVTGGDRDVSLVLPGE